MGKIEADIALESWLSCSGQGQFTLPRYHALVVLRSDVILSWLRRVV